MANVLEVLIKKIKAVCQEVDSSPERWHLFLKYYDPFHKFHSNACQAWFIINDTKSSNRFIFVVP